MTWEANVELLPLGELGDIASGATPKTGVQEYWNGDIPWITPADLTKHEGVWFRGRLKRISKSGFEACSTRMLPRGSILFSSRAPIGHCAVAAYPLCTNQGFKSLVPNKRLDSVYGYFALRAATPSIISQGRGATFAEVSKEIMESVRIPVRPLPEQKRIAAILEKVDRLRCTRRYAGQLSDSFLQSVFLQMFGDCLEEEGSGVLNDFLARPLSNGSFEINKFYGSGTPVIWVDDLYHTTTIDIGHLRRAKLSEPAIQKYSLLEGDLLFTRSSLVREGIGRINIVPRLRERTAFECHIIRARVDQKKVDPFYVLGLYRSAYGRRFIMSRANTATMTTIGQSAIGELPCPVPPLRLQQQFADLVRRFECLRAQQREAERQAEHLFQTLLHRAFAPAQ